MTRYGPACRGALLPIVLFGLLAQSPQAVAEEPARPPATEELIGVWAGARRFGPVARGTLTLERRDSTWRAEIAGFRIEPSWDAGFVAFSLPDELGSFRGRLEAATGSITGQWIQPGVTSAFGQRFSTPLRLDRVGVSLWRGTVRPLEDTVHLYLVIEAAPEGGVRAFLRNPEVNFGRFFGPLQVLRSNDAIELRGTLAWQPESDPRALLSGIYRPDQDLLSIFVEDLGGTFDLARLRAGSNSGFRPRPASNPPRGLATPLPRADGWPVASLGEVGLAAEPIAALVDKIATAPIDAVDAPAIDALLVARRGRLVVEEYFHDHSGELTHDVRSASKSLTATLVGAAVHTGEVTLSTPVYSTLGGGTTPEDLDPRAVQITLENLIAMDSGLPCDDWDPDSPGGEDRVQSQRDQPDWHRYLLDLPVERAPGERATYCSVGMSVAGAVVARSLGETLTEAFDRLLGRPLELGAYHTNLMPNGQAYAGGGLRIGARDFLKFGQLMLDDGTWKGRRVLDAGWAARVLERRHDLGSARLGTYTAGWWLLEYEVDGRRFEAFYAGGNGGNYIICIPELDLAVVFQASNYNQAIQHRTKLEDVPRYLIRAALEGGTDPDGNAPDLPGPARRPRAGG